MARYTPGVKGQEREKPKSPPETPGLDVRAATGTSARLLVKQATYDECVKAARQEFHDQTGMLVFDASSRQLGRYNEILKGLCAKSGANIPPDVKL